MTQQDIVNRVNSYLVNYRVNWDEIKYFADGAILKINDLLGAKYPPMSEVLNSVKASYSLLTQGHYVPIFPERYISTVVIPYIITEVLARDEEFTTIYNKFATDLDNNLYIMFQNEFNQVPQCFRQRADVGVYIDTINQPTSKIHGRMIGNIFEEYKQVEPNYCTDNQDFVFTLSYSFGNANIVNSDLYSLPIDTNTYHYNDSAVVSDINAYILNGAKIFISANGSTVYKFLGWSYDKDMRPETLINANDTITIQGDTTLYAIWSEESTLYVDFTDDAEGVLKVYDTYAPYITNLVIPNYVNGNRVNAIASSFDKGLINIKTVVLPSVLRQINPNAFIQPTLTSVVFPDYNNIYNAPNICIQPKAFRLDLCKKLQIIYVPKSVSEIRVNGFFQDDDSVNPAIYLEYTKDNVPTSYNLDDTYIRIYYGCSRSGLGGDY